MSVGTTVYSAPWQLNNLDIKTHLQVVSLCKGTAVLKIALGNVFGGLMKEDIRLSNIVVSESGNKVLDTTLIVLLCESLFPILNGKGAAVTPNMDPEA